MTRSVPIASGRARFLGPHSLVLLTAALTASCGGDGNATDPPEEEPPVLEVGAATLTRPDGSALDVSNVAGTFIIDLDASIPQGFSGTVIVTIDGTEVYNEPITGSPPPGADVASDAVGRAGNVQVVVDASIAEIPAASITDVINALPRFTNGPHVADIQIRGTAGGTQLVDGTTVNFTTNQPDLFAAVLNTERSYSNGFNWRAGDATVQLIHIPFSGVSDLDQIDVTVGPAALYGSATAGVVNFITRRSGNGFEPIHISADQLSWTSATEGDRFWIQNVVAASGQSRQPADFAVLGGNCFDADLDGFADGDSPARSTLPAGCNRFIPWQLSARYNLGDALSLSVPIHFDNEGPDVPVGAFRLLDADYTLGGTGRDPATGSFCCRENWIGVGFNLRSGFNLQGINDAGSGMNPSPQIDFYANLASSLATDLYRAENMISETPDASAFTAGQYHRIGSGLSDNIGNRTWVPLSTSLSNPRQVDGSVDSSPGDGTPAGARFDAIPPMISEYRSNFGQRTINTSGSYNFDLRYAADDADSGVDPLGWFASIAFGQTCLVGSGSSCETGEVVQGDSNGDAHVTSGAVAGMLPSDWQGQLAVRVMARDLAGNVAVEEQTTVTRDYTPPDGNAQLPASPTAGGMTDIQIDAMDNLGVKSVSLGFLAAPFISSYFANNQVHAFFEATRLDPVSAVVAALLPVYFATGIQLFGQSGPEGPVHPITDLLLRIKDAGRNSIVRQIAIPVALRPLPVTPAGVLAFAMSPLSAVVCAYRDAAKCGNLPAALTYSLAITMAANAVFPFITAHLFALSLADKRIIPLCVATTAVVAATLYTYSCLATFSALAAGQYVVFWWALATNGLIGKTTPFGFIDAQKPPVTGPGS